MDRKAQIGLWAVVIAAVSILVGLALYSSIAPNIGQMTQTRTVTNASFTLPASAATSELTICGQKALTYVLVNTTDYDTVPTTNYTISQSAGADGYLAAKITTTANSKYASKPVFVNCTLEPKGYIDDGGSRGIVVLIAIFFALLIVSAALPNVREGIGEFFGRG